MNLQDIDASASPEVQMNENFESIELISVYGKRHPVTTGLTWGYWGGRWNGIAITAGTLTLTNAGDNYVVVLKSTGAISTTVAATNWNNTGLYSRVYKITCAGGVVTAVEDHRAGLYGVHGWELPATSPTILTSIVTTSTTFTAFAGATVRLDIGGTGATSVVNIPGTKSGTTSTSASVTLNSLGVAENAFVGGTLGVTGASTLPTIYGSSAANGDITIEGTSSATKTTSYVILQPTGGSVCVGVAVPDSLVHLAANNSSDTRTLTFENTTQSATKGYAGMFAGSLYLRNNVYYAGGNVVPNASNGTSNIELGSPTANGYISFGTGAINTVPSESMRITGTTIDMVASGTTLTVGVGADNGTVSAGVFTDRTKAFEGDALAEIRKIKTKNGHIDHDTLPEFVRATVKRPIHDYVISNNNGVMTANWRAVGEEEVTERSLGAAISMLLVGMQQLDSRLAAGQL